MLKKVCALVFALGACLGSAASACYLCAVQDGHVDCELVIGETGGISCTINCTTSGGREKCYCRTLGNCGGSNGCNGEPCPVARRQQSWPSAPLSRPVSVWLTRDQFEKMEALNSDAAMLVATLARDSDALLIGLKEAIPFVPGESQGIFSVAPLGADGKPGLKKFFRYTANVLQEGDGVLIRVEVEDHPTFRSLYAQFRNGAADDFVEIVNSEGRGRRWEN